MCALRSEPRTTMRYDRARNNLDRHPNDILAAYVASGTLESDHADERKPDLAATGCRFGG